MLTKILLAACLLHVFAVSLVRAQDVVNPSRPRQCFSCEGINCQRTSRMNVSVACSDLLDICVTIFDDFTVVAKGCYSDMPDAHRVKCEHDDNPECFKCFGELCNNKGRADFKCIECSSSSNDNCASNMDTMAAVQCPVPTAPNSYCYVRNDGANSVSRGCYVHQQEQIDCMNSASCSLCLSGDGEACNAYRVGNNTTSGGAYFKPIRSIVVLLLVYLTV